MTDTPDPHSSDPQRPGQPPAGPGQPPAPNPYAAGSQPTGPGAPGPGTPPAGGLPPTPPNDLPPGPPSDDRPRRFNPLLGLLLVIAIAVLAATQLLGGDDDEGTVPPPPAATTPQATTPAATTPDGTTPEATTPGGVVAGADDPTVAQAKTAVRTLVPLMQDCFARTQDYTQCVEDPAVTGAGIAISDEPTPGGVRLKASGPGSFAIIAPDAAGRNWVFKKNAGVPSKRTCEQRGDAPCASKTW